MVPIFMIWRSLLSATGVYRTYYRVQTPTQTEQDIEMQINSLEIWGKPAQNVFQSDKSLCRQDTERQGRN